ncbi:dipeptide transport system permease protein DppC [Clostridium tepidiprofundi DSM 19306]|uniref:Dipeptide transport system permease protein DppC n=1 Tax=Clostridium tepidiprofundi DSM 19306 TaxID=1121338 RepID=A0A151ATB0_9CLOT|nr:oligopeptide ABC transporter permease [Clostridium tepidiprofundi]KYH30888.1 dipeptide transport system permease protein DppC [Clostridium tepidiprofundi DSM 19306]
MGGKVEINTKNKLNIEPEQKKEVVLSPGRIVWNRLKRNKLAMTGLVIIVILVVAAAVYPIVSPYDVYKIDLTKTELPPSWAHPLGTDDVGRDVLTRLMYAGRISLLVGVVAVSIEVIIGSIVGVVSGYFGGIVDSIMMRIVDVIMCFPFLCILIMLSAVMSDLHVNPNYRIFIVMFIIGIIGWTGLSRIVRGQMLSLREQEFMQAAEALGLSDRRKMFRHLLPNALASIIVYATLGIGGAILSESALSFLGLGVTPPIPSWGQMAQKCRDMYVLQFEPWLWVPPGLCIFLAVMSINLLGDGLRDAIDPKLKR